MENRFENPNIKPEPEKENEEKNLQAEVLKIKNEVTQLCKKYGTKEIFHEIKKFVDMLKSEYPKDCYDYALFHAVQFSSFRGEPLEDKLDFPGDFSIKKFIENLTQKLEKIDTIRSKWKNLINRENGPEINEEAITLLKKSGVENRYPVEEYAAYHIIGGSGPKPWPEFPANRTDFPEDDSIEKLLDKLAEEYKNK